MNWEGEVIKGDMLRELRRWSDKGDMLRELRRWSDKGDMLRAESWLVRRQIELEKIEAGEESEKKNVCTDGGENTELWR